MAVVKANYVKRGGEAKALAKATIRYIHERPGKRGEKSTRDLFGADGVLTREQVNRMIDEAEKATYFYRLVISPDPRKEDSPRDIDLRELTIQAIANLEQKLKTSILFAAAVHADHAPHRHVHVLALLNKKLTKGDVSALRQSATRISVLQRQLRDLSAGRGLSAKHTLRVEPGLKRQPVSRGVIPRRKSAGLYAAPVRVGTACPRGCGGYAQTMTRLSSKIHKCDACGIVVRKVGLDYQIEGPKLFLGRGL